MGDTTKNLVSRRKGLIRVRMAPHQTGPELESLKRQISRFGVQQNAELDILVDVSKVKTSDEGANTAAKSFFRDLSFRRMAVFGGSKVVNVGIRLILNLFISPGNGEVKLFKTEDEALDWLHADR